MCSKYAENVHVLQKMCRRSAAIAENLQKKKSAEQNTCKQKEHMRNYRRQYRKNNRERINEYWICYYAKNEEQINQRLRNQRQRKIGARDQESKKLESSLVPSDTFCGTPMAKT